MYIFPVVPATAATMLKAAGHDVLWLDGIAEELSPEELTELLDSMLDPTAYCLSVVLPQEQTEGA